jgi:hypothetical protein
MMESLDAQAPPPLSFFPHHQGDIWEYVGSAGNYFQNRITADSLGPDGRFYIETTMFGKMRIDTTTFEVHGRIWAGGEYENLIYKLDADVGEWWTVSRRQQYSIQAHVVAIYGTVIFGNIPTIVKVIEEVDSASHLQLLTDYLASDFGLIGQDIDLPSFRIRGTLINGIQHGIITSVKEYYTSLEPKAFVLYQNFPNPYNPSTVIEYELFEATEAELKVSDMLGQEARVLVNAHQPKGNYKVDFHAEGLSSGVYVYTLKTSRGMKSKRMLLLR